MWAAFHAERLWARQAILPLLADTIACQESAYRWTVRAHDLERPPAWLVLPVVFQRGLYRHLPFSRVFIWKKKKIQKFICDQLTRILSNLDDFVASSILVVETLTTVVCIVTYFASRIPIILEWYWSTCRVQDTVFVLPAFCSFFTVLFSPPPPFFICFSFSFFIVRFPTNEICE